jgi:hypothetical protein
VVDEAHYFLSGANVHELLDLELGGYTLITYQAAHLHPDVQAANDTTIVTLATDPREVQAFATMSGLPHRHLEWASVLGQLALAEAAVLPPRDADAGYLRRFRLVPRLSSHERHREQYLDVPVPAGRAFVFCTDGGPTGCRASTLKELLEVVATTPLGVLDGHLRRSTSRAGSAMSSATTSWRRRCGSSKSNTASGGAVDVNDRLVEAIRERYELPDSLSVHLPPS